MRPVTLFGVLCLFLSGCSVFNPYNGEFTCPKTFNGKCVSPTSAYQESVDGNPKEKEDEGLKPSKNGGEDKKKGGAFISEASYQNALYEKLTGLLKEPTTPMIAPPQIMRVLILPYRGEDSRLYMPRYVYIIVDAPKWVLGNQWLNEESSARETAMPSTK